MLVIMADDDPAVKTLFSPDIPDTFLLFTNLPLVGSVRKIYLKTDLIELNIVGGTTLSGSIYSRTW